MLHLGEKCHVILSLAEGLSMTLFNFWVVRRRTRSDHLFGTARHFTKHAHEVAADDFFNVAFPVSTTQ